MPLIKSASEEAFKKNLKAELNAGKPKKQALAIAYDVQDRAEESKMSINRKKLEAIVEGFLNEFKDSNEVGGSLWKSDRKILANNARIVRKSPREDFHDVRNSINMDIAHEASTLVGNAPPDKKEEASNRIKHHIFSKDDLERRTFPEYHQKKK